MVVRALESGGLRRELEDVRQAHQILADQIEAMSGQLGALFEGVERDVARRSEELTSEVRMLEDLVQRMSEGLDERRSPPRGPTARRPRHAQHAALLETVREALADNRVDLYLQPVVSLPQRRTVFYESFSRLRDATGPDHDAGRIPAAWPSPRG